MVNDVSIIAGIITVFVLIGVILPYVQAEFGQSVTSVDVAGLAGDVGSKGQESSAVTFWDVLLSIFSMFFWTFGNLPFWLDLCFFLPIRIILGFIVARNIWIGGGG
jgi:hypothetical protein